MLNKSEKNPYSSWTTLTLLFIVSLILRVLLISKGPYHVDCLHLALNAATTLETGKITPLFGPGYPLTVILGSVFVFITRFFGIHDPVISVNWMSVIFSSATIPVFYLFVKKILDSRTALLSAISLTILPLFLGLSTYGKSHTPSLFFLVAGFLYLSNYRQTKKLHSLIFSALLFGCMGGCRLQDLILMLIPINFFLLMPTITYPKYFNSKIKNILILNSIILSLTFLFHIPIISQNSTGYSSQFSRFWTIGVSSNFRGILSPSLGNTWNAIVLTLTPIGVLIAFMGFYLLFRKSKNLTLFLSLWVIIPIIFYGNLTTTAPRFLMVALFPFLISIGYLFNHFLKYKAILIRCLTLAAFTGIQIAALIFIVPILNFRHHNDLLPEYGRKIGRITEPNALIITGDEKLFISHYSKRQTTKRPNAIIQFKPNQLDQFQDKLNHLLARNTPVYITMSGLYSYNPGHIFSKMLQTNYRLEPVLEATIEDWHHGETILRVGPERLFRVLPLSPSTE